MNTIRLLRPGKSRACPFLLLLVSVLLGLVFTSFSTIYARFVVSPRDWPKGIEIASVSSSAAFLSATIDRFDRIHMMFTDKRADHETILYMKIDATGEMLIPVFQISDSWATSTSPSVAIDSAGNAHIVWVDNRDGNDEIYYAKVDNLGTKIIFDKRLTFDPRQSLAPAVAVDSKGNVHVVWQDLREEITIFPVNFEVYYLKLDNNGNVLVSERRLTPADTRYSFGPSIVVDHKDRVHVLWIDNRDTEHLPFHEVFYKRLDLDGNALSEEKKITSISKRVTPPRAPSPIIDSRGNLVLAFLDERPRLKFGVYLKRLDFNGTSLGPDLTVTSSSTDLGGYAGPPRATIDRSDRVYVISSDLRSDWGPQKLYRDERFHVLFGDWKFTPLYLEFRRQLYGVRLDAGQVLNEDCITSGLESSMMPSICTDSRGTMHLVWLQARDKLSTITYANNAVPVNLLVGSIVAEYRQRILYDWQVALAVFIFFVMQESFFLALFLTAAVLVIVCVRRGFGSMIQTEPKMIVIQLLALVLVKAVIVNLIPISITYPRGISHLLTGFPAAMMTVSVAIVGRVRMATKSRQMFVASTCELLNLFYTLCLIAPLALEPVY